MRSIFSFLQIGLVNRQLFIILFKQYLSKALNTMQPVHEILVLIVHDSSHSFFAHAQLSSETSCFIFRSKPSSTSIICICEQRML